jgi:hypothetical protein
LPKTLNVIITNYAYPHNYEDQYNIAFQKYNDMKGNGICTLYVDCPQNVYCQWLIHFRHDFKIYFTIHLDRNDQTEKHCWCFTNTESLSIEISYFFYGILNDAFRHDALQRCEFQSLERLLFEITSIIL